MKRLRPCSVLFLLFSFCLLALSQAEGNNDTTCGRRTWESVSTDFLYRFRHYAKFYGCPKTVYGNFFKRSFLFSDLGGFRDRIFDRGIYLDASMSQFFASNYTGGEEQDFMRCNGTSEYWLIIDTGKLGLWPKGALMLHPRTTWLINETVVEDVGSIAAATVSAVISTTETVNSTLSEVVLGQVVSENFSFRLGKLDATGPIDENVFANSSRHQFTYTGLVNNPIIFTFTPYTLLAFLPAWNAGEKHELMILIGDADGRADESGFDTLFNGSATFCFQYRFSPMINDLSGNYRFLICYATKPLTSYALDSRHVLGRTITDIPIPKKCEDFAWLFNFDQNLWERETGEKAGLFGRVGWAPPDRNVIDEFYSIGIGGRGMIFKNRIHDEWGIGYAATHISGHLSRDLEEDYEIEINDFEHAVEAYNNIRITPALHWTISAQVIRPPLKSRGTAFVISSRLRVDF